MASSKAISAACDAKKENLRKAYEDIQSNSSLLASFGLQWKDLEEHIDSIQKSIEERFKVLESREMQAGNGSAIDQSLLEKVKSNGSQSFAALIPGKKVGDSELSPHPEMISLCLRMDGKGLRSYIIENRKEQPEIRDVIGAALQYASDPAKLVLDAMQGLYPPNSRGDDDVKLAAIRRTCFQLLKQLMGISPQIKPQVKEKARELALEWKGKVSTGGENPLEAFAFLQLLATYGLVDAFSADELLDFIVPIARRTQAIELCRALGFTDKVPELIQKLSNKGKLLEAVKYVSAFELADKFPPVPLLKAYIKESKKLAQEIRKKGKDSIKSQNEASAKEIAALKVVIQYIQDYKLESEFPRSNLEKRLEQLEKQKADRKRSAAESGHKPQQQQGGNKRPRDAAPVSSQTVAGATSTIFPPISQVHLQPSSLLPDNGASYFSSTAQRYGLGSSSLSGAPYVNSHADPYGLAGNPSSFGGNLSPPRSHLYSSESHSSGLYDRPLHFGGYGLPSQFPPSFYP